MMTIAVAYDDGAVFQHFGRTEQFKLYKIDHGVITATALLPCGEAHCGALAGLLADNGVDALLCGNIGAGAKDAVQRAGLMLFAGVCGDADEAAKAFAEGTLCFAPDTLCAAHADGGCGGHKEAGIC